MGAPAEKVEDSFLCDIEHLIAGSVVAGPADHADLLIACARVIHRDVEEISEIAGITRRALLDFRTLITRELLDAEGL